VTVQDITFSFSLNRIANDFITALAFLDERERGRGRGIGRGRGRHMVSRNKNRYCCSNMLMSTAKHSLHCIENSDSQPVGTGRLWGCCKWALN